MVRQRRSWLAIELEDSLEMFLNKISVWRITTIKNPWWSTTCVSKYVNLFFRKRIFVLKKTEIYSFKTRRRSDCRGHLQGWSENEVLLTEIHFDSLYFGRILTDISTRWSECQLYTECKSRHQNEFIRLILKINLWIEICWKIKSFVFWCNIPF